MHGLLISVHPLLQLFMVSATYILDPLAPAWLLCCLMISYVCTRSTSTCVVHASHLTYSYSWLIQQRPCHRAYDSHDSTSASKHILLYDTFTSERRSERV